MWPLAPFLSVRSSYELEYVREDTVREGIYAPVELERQESFFQSVRRRLERFLEGEENVSGFSETLQRCLRFRIKVGIVFPTSKAA